MKLIDLLTSGSIRALREHKEIILAIQKRSAEAQILRAREAGEDEQRDNQEMGERDAGYKATRESYPEEITFPY